MKKTTLISFALFVATSMFSQEILLKIDAEGDFKPSEGKAFSSLCTDKNNMVHLCVTDEGLSYEANTGSNRTVSSSSLSGKDSESLIRSQYLSSGSSFWYLGKVNTEGYKEINISAWHSGALSGTSLYEPQKNWIFEYCVGDAEELYWDNGFVEWKQIKEYSIELNKWIETAITLPEECNDKKAISFRWISNKDGIGVNGGSSSTNGWAWIDEISVIGNPVITSNIEGISKNEANVYVAGNMIVINNYNGRAVIYDIAGRMIEDISVDGNASVASENNGIYIVKLDNATENIITKVNVR